MRKLTRVRRIGFGIALSAAAIAFSAMGAQSMVAAETIREPRTTLRFIEPERTAAESSAAKSTRDDRGTSVVIRGASARLAQVAVPSHVVVGGNPAASPTEIVNQGDVSARLRLDVAASRGQPGMTASHATGKTEVQVKPLPDSSRIIAQPVARGVAFNILRSEEVTVGRPSTHASNVASRPNVLRMGDKDTTPDGVRVVSYQDRPQDQPVGQAHEHRPGEPRQQAFSAAPMNGATERLGPFEVTDQLEVLSIVQYCGKVLRTTRKVSRTEVADPNVCAVVQFTPGQLSIVAKQAGQTQVTFWFDGLQGKPISYLIQVVPNPLVR